MIEQTRHAKLSAVPAVVQFDGIWLREQAPTQMHKSDTRGCQRQQHKGKKVVVLVALGFWTDGSGKREILDWQGASGEDKASWESLVNRVWQRGLQPENGLQAVIRDGCGKVGESLAFVYGARMIEQRCICAQTAQCSRQVSGGTQRRCSQANKKAASGAGECDLSS